MSTEQAGSSGPVSASIRAVANWPERLSETAYAYLLLTPVFLVLGAVAFWPLAETFWTSLHADSLLTVGVGEFIGFGNYIELLTGDAALPNPFLDLSQPFSSALTLTLIFTIISVAFETVIGLGAALVLNQDFRGRRWARVAIILPWAVPIVIQGMIFYLMFDPQVDFLQPIFTDWGIITPRPFNDTKSSLFITIVADVWKTSAFMALLILAGLQTVDRSLYDVAKVAGATKWQQFKFITFPIILPTILVAMLFRTIAAMRIYGLIETMSGCSVMPSLSCLVVSTYFGAAKLASAAAIAFITAAIIGVFVSIYIVGYAREGI